ncbi:DUF4262 domain-containing protein [Micromonospora sp. WMMC273]|uniref:DUF4262 domain-containing protein n=1 Tax=Micromonospora sp. WMMC273 TaxID=3015157 RepID=UPI0022B601E5|nr:DUF4262 domain-containing protein [Micromonospora sp. WMMC273]MCZ7478824.1 DUF4262 domain-containing protein [Micromonospora sp. WMMC273]MCZ7478952.1 DUF4262 domain-containing protein [Micromonospora sp. WMMC273]
MEDDQDETVAAVREVVAAHGWAVKGVGPNIAYTVGLTEAGLPELVLIGVRVEVAARVLNDLARRSLEAELTPELLYAVGEFRRPVGVRAVPMDVARRVLRYATALYGDRWRVWEVVPGLTDEPPTV